MPPKKNRFFSQQPKGRARQFLESNYSLPDVITHSTLCQNGHVFLQYLDNDKVFVHTAQKISKKFNFSPDVDRIHYLVKKASILMNAIHSEPSRTKFEDLCKEYFVAKPIASSSTTGRSDLECTPILISTENVASEISQSDMMQTDSQTTSAVATISEPFPCTSITIMFNSINVFFLSFCSFVVISDTGFEPCNALTNRQHKWHFLLFSQTLDLNLVTP